MNEFLRSGNKIVTRPDGLDFNLEPGSVYALKYDNWEGDTFLEIGSTITLPDNVFKSDSDNRFITKVLDHFKTTTHRTTGVLFSGLKGSGKTVMSKVLAIESGLPIIIVSSDFPTRYLNKFFSKFKDTNVCVMFDEIDKNERSWNTEDLLGFLDGIQSTAKKMVLLTCNSDSKLNEFIMNRCSRIRYCKKFDALNEESIKCIGNNILNDKSEVDVATKFVMEKFKVVSYDNVASFFEEINTHPTDSFEEVVADLNISLK